MFPTIAYWKPEFTLEQVARTFCRFTENGLLQNQGITLKIEKYLKAYLSVYNTVEAVSLADLSDYVIILGFGYTLSVVVLLIEIFAFKMKNSVLWRRAFRRRRKTAWEESY